MCVSRNYIKSQLLIHAKHVGFLLYIKEPPNKYFYNTHWASGTQAFRLTELWLYKAIIPKITYMLEKKVSFRSRKHLLHIVILYNNLDY